MADSGYRIGERAKPRLEEVIRDHDRQDTTRKRTARASMNPVIESDGGSIMFCVVREIPEAPEGQSALFVRVQRVRPGENFEDDGFYEPIGDVIPAFLPHGLVANQYSAFVWPEGQAFTRQTKVLKLVGISGKLTCLLEPQGHLYLKADPNAVIGDCVVEGVT